MNAFDILVLVYIGLAARRGFKNGLAAEFFRLFRIAVAILAGSSLYRLFSDAVSGLFNIDSGYSDPLLFVVSAAVVWKLLQKMRRWIETLILSKTPQRVRSTGGAIAAALKAGIFVVAIVTTVSLSTWMPWHKTIAEDSMTGHLVQQFLPET